MRMLLLLSLLVLALGQPLRAMQLEERKLFCPITGRPFTVKVIPFRAGARWNFGAPGPADMGTDEDGCRHDSGFSEYDYYVITSPWCYFSAMSIEWDRSGKYRGHLPAGFKEWILGPEINGEFVTDRIHSYKRMQRRFARGNMAMPDFKDWEIPQEEIPVEKKYRLALACYEKRNYPKSFLAKLALNGAWGIRVALTRPLAIPQMAGASQEVNHFLNQYIQDGEAFDRDKWAQRYLEIYDNGKLSEEARFLAGMQAAAFQLRLGNQIKSEGILNEMFERYKDEGNKHNVLKALARTRLILIRQNYLTMMRAAFNDFGQALANEEYPRTRMPEVLIALAELHRRLGDLQGAMDWYTCLAKMPETQPQLRKDIRAAGGAPASEVEGRDVSYLVHLGWKADLMIERLKALGVAYTGTPEGSAKSLINAILNEGLGTPEYKSPTWEAMTGRDPKTVELYLGEVGKSVLDYYLRVKIYPDRLGDLWMEGIVKDRNRLNRFCCPQTGAPFLYLRPDETAVVQNTVLVATDKPIKTNDGERYAGFLYNAKVVWSKKPLMPGDRYTP